MVEVMNEQTDGRLLKRFASQQDQAAFAALVRRHGPMVLAVCRRVLGNAHDADDAFQATFLVLVRKAGAIARPELLANWLYGVAYRVAVKARANAARRSKHEQRAPVKACVDPVAEATGREVHAVLDAELRHLPEQYRAPLVLCYLEGKTNAEAACMLGWPTGSISGRLARARELLRMRLVRRWPSSIRTRLYTGRCVRFTQSELKPDIIGGTTYNGSFSLIGETIP
jgi:RNA polymerase sigma factor (sigma-70 family)